MGRTAMGAGDDGRPDFAARKACNYLQDSVEDCGNILLGECNTADKVAEINRMKGEPEVEYVPPSTEDMHEVAYAGASKARGVIVAGIILVQPFILAFL